MMRISLVTLLSLLMSWATVSAEVEMLHEGSFGAEALKQGERMYREGILPSGEPMKAIVMGDIPVDGRMFTCDDCHQRSGLGSVEGTVITWPTNGKELYEPRRRTEAWRPPEDERARREGRKALPPYWQVEDERPAYTDSSLARLLRVGVDPAGRKLDPIMPLYMLDQQDMDVLVHYLKNLSVDPAPGIDDTAIQFATVITAEVPEEKRLAMLSALHVHVDVHNSQNRHQERRSVSGPWYKTEKHQAYRRFQLHVWELQGAEDTWADQLDDFYRKQPVFGLLGGITTGSWKPVHDFCEQNRIPSLFPLTDLPVVSESDWYTLYFSKGLYQEGEAAARYLHKSGKLGSNARVVQIVQQGKKSAALAQGFEETWQQYDRPAPLNRMLGEDEVLSQHILDEIIGQEEPEILLLWLENGGLAAFQALENVSGPPQMVVASSSLIKTNLSEIPDSIRKRLFLTYPQSLPGENAKGRSAVEGWLKARNIPVLDVDVQSKMYFLGWMLSGSIKHMRSEFFREYFLEGFDMMIDQDYAIAVYPRLTFGPGQRYASKGCYIVQLTLGPDPQPVKVSDWVIH